MCELEGIPHKLIIDSGHIMPPHFDGNPIITALGIGPCCRDEIKNITKKFKLA
jgi:PTH2 family peptidyl-tRNA hydrolase